MPTNKKLAQYIDHTLLSPGADEAGVVKLCQEAKEYGFRTVCLYPKWLPVAVKELKGSDVMPIAVVGFPEGNHPTSTKVEETTQAVSLGALEIDMVLNRELMHGGDYQKVFEDIRAVVQAAKVPVKVILETSELSQDEKIAACVLTKAAGAAFVKTSTGFSGGGATEEDVRLMRHWVGPDFGVKASGGIRDRATADKMVAAGASRLGCSASVAIVSGSSTGEGY